MISVTDIVIIIILLAGVAIGAIRGFLKSIAGLLVLIASLIGSYFITNIITEPVTDFVLPRVEEYVEDRIKLDDIDPSGIASIDELVETFQGKETALLSAVTQQFVRTAVRTLCYALVFLVLMIILHILVRLLDDILEKTPFKHINKLLGAAAGLLETMLLLYLAVYVLSLLGVPWINEAVQDGGLMAFFKQTSPFALLRMLA